MIGVWYEGGSAYRPCYIAATDNKLLAINNHSAARVILMPDGTLFLSSWNAHGEIIQDKLLWSDGTWWSRNPSNYGNTMMPWGNGAPFHSGYFIPD